MVAKYTPEGDCLAGKGWDIKSEVTAGICTEFIDLFESVVNSSSRKNRIFRLFLDCRVDTWRLISVTINRQRSLDAPTTKEKLLGPARSHTHSLAILSIQETKSWDVPNLELPGYVFRGCEFGFRTLLVPKQFCTIKRSWKS